MSDRPYLLHYAPDNASLVIRLALEEIGCAYDTALVDRRHGGQHDPAYLALNPNGLIPVLETSEGPIFETAAILLWLTDRHGVLGPRADETGRGDYLKWLFFLSNTLHPCLRMLFYTETYIGPDPVHRDQLVGVTRAHVNRHLGTLETIWRGAEPPLGLTLYLAPMMRWLALYPAASDRSWYNAARWPHLFRLLAQLETRASAIAAQRAEGLGPAPFTAPQSPRPPEGSAT